MKLVHKTVTTVAVSLSAVLGMWGAPVYAHNGEHHDHDHDQPSTQVPTSSTPSSTTTTAYTPVVRENVLDMTPQEISDFVNAIFTLKNTYVDGSPVSVYDQFVAIHVETMGFMAANQPMAIGYTTMGTMDMDMNMEHMAMGPAAEAGVDVAHSGSALLPWHREYTRLFELALETVNPNVTIPYFDWTDPQAWNVVFSDGFLGGNGTGQPVTIPGVGTFDGGVVSSGPFTPDRWVLNNDINLDFQGKPRGTELQRYMGVVPFDTAQAAADAQTALSQDNYLSFRPAVEGWPFLDNTGTLQAGLMTHNSVHGAIGGGILDSSTTPPTFTQLGTMTFVASPYDPVFWLVHANVDRLWAEWQDDGHAGSNYYPSQGQPYGHNLNDFMWPWDASQSTPANLGPGDLLSYLPDFGNYTVTPTDVLDYRALGYTYDTSPASDDQPETVPVSLPDWLESIGHQGSACAAH